MWLWFFLHRAWEQCRMQSAWLGKSHRFSPFMCLPFSESLSAKQDDPNAQFYFRLLTALTESLHVIGACWGKSSRLIFPAPQMPIHSWPLPERMRQKASNFERNLQISQLRSPMWKSCCYQMNLLCLEAPRLSRFHFGYSVCRVE